MSGIPEITSSVTIRAWWSFCFYVFKVGSITVQILHIIHLFVQDLFKGLGKSGIIVLLSDIIFRSHVGLCPYIAGECIPSTSHVRAIFSAALYGYLTC